MALLEGFNPEQESAFKRVCDESRPYFTSCAPLDQARAEAAIAAWYLAKGRAKPLFLTFPSPESAMQAVSLILVSSHVGDAMLIRLGEQLKTKYWNSFGMVARRQFGERCRSISYSETRSNQIDDVYYRKLIDFRFRFGLCNRLNRANQQINREVSNGTGLSIEGRGECPTGEGHLDRFLYQSFGILAMHEEGTPEFIDLRVEIEQSCHFWWPMEGICLLSERPVILNLDDSGDIHSLIEPAISYSDGWSIFAVHGVSVPEWVIRHPARITVEAIEKEGNFSIRDAMIEIFGGQDRYWIESGARLIDECPSNHPIVGLRTARLYRKSEKRRIVMRLDMQNSTPEPDGTSKRYMIGVDHKAYGGIKDCLAAMASTYRMPDGSLLFQRPQDYAPEIET